MIDFSAMKGALARPLRWMAHSVPSGAVIPILQGPLRGYRWVAGSSNAGCWLGSYESDVQALMTRLATPGAVVFDIGANVGFFSLLASKLVGPSGRVIAFEPHPKNLRYLRRHIHLNGADNITVVEAAVSDRAGSVLFEGAGALGHIATGDSERRNCLEVRTVAIDELVATGAIPRPALVKLDVEGAEYSVLRGMIELLETSRPNMLVELHGRHIDGLDIDTECRRLFRELGYDLRKEGHEVHAVPLAQGETARTDSQ